MTQVGVYETREQALDAAEVWLIGQGHADLNGMVWLVSANQPPGTADTYEFPKARFLARTVKEQLQDAAGRERD